MPYVVYDENTKVILSITNEEPIISDSELVVQSDMFNPGDEFECLITIADIDENGDIRSVSQVKQSPTASFFSKEIARLKEENEQYKKENADLKKSQADQDEVIMQLLIGGV